MYRVGCRGLEVKFMKRKKVLVWLKAQARHLISDVKTIENVRFGMILQSKYYVETDNDKYRDFMNEHS